MQVGAGPSAPWKCRADALSRGTIPARIVFYVMRPSVDSRSVTLLPSSSNEARVISEQRPSGLNSFTDDASTRLQEHFV